jgi:DNA-binding NarL/FixJ family response regulator
MLTNVGMIRFADRARRELLATGATGRRRSPETLDNLTRREAQIAQLAAGGLSNPEIATRLFVSPRTAEHHLVKVFTKLGIGSRVQLRSALAAQEDTAATVTRTSRHPGAAASHGGTTRPLSADAFHG